MAAELGTVGCEVLMPAVGNEVLCTCCDCQRVVMLLYYLKLQGAKLCKQIIMAVFLLCDRLACVASWFIFIV